MCVMPPGSQTADGRRASARPSALKVPSMLVPGSLPPPFLTAAFSEVVFPSGERVQVHVADTLARDDAVAGLLTGLIMRAADSHALERDVYQVGEELGLEVTADGPAANRLVVIDRAAGPFDGG